MCKLSTDSVLYTALIKSIEEENKDIAKYKEMAEIACNSGYPEIKGVLCDIKKDECSHAKILEYIRDKYS